MGILNITPDSFHDGGRYSNLDNAHERAVQIMHEGADIIDIGGESTRPGSEEISVEEEIARVLPLIERLREDRRFEHMPISIDTRKHEVAKLALEKGCDFINDQSGCNKELLELGREYPIIVMHKRGTSKTMQDFTDYPAGVVETVVSELLARIYSLNLPRYNICLDPGIGFAKVQDQSWELLRDITKFQELTKFPLCIGASNKKFLKKFYDEDNKYLGNLAVIASSAFQGANILRVHEVKQTVDFLKAIDHLKGPRSV